MDNSGSFHNALITRIQDIQTTRYAQLSSCIVIIFDHLITLDDEVTLIWISPWSLGKVLFLINRYFTLGSVIFNTYALFSPKITDEVCKPNQKKHSGTHLICLLIDDSCLRMFQWQGWTGLVAFMIADAILQIRIYALYSLNKKVLALMLIPYVVSCAYSAWIVIDSNSSSTSAAAISLPVGGSFCVGSHIPRQFFRFWIPMIAFDFFLCNLALFHEFRTLRSEGSVFLSGRRLIGILIRDSVFYFVVIFITYLTCLLIWAVARQSLLEVPLGFSVALSCVLTNRLMLNLRKV